MTSAGFESVVSPTQSSPFSISDILSNEKIGQKRSPTSHHGVSISLTTPGSSSNTRAPIYPIVGQETAKQQKHGSMVTPKRPRNSSSSHSASRQAKITLTEAGNMATSTIGYQGSHKPLTVTPNKPLGPSQINSSLISPFNTNVLLALGQRPSPEKEELFGESSLGMLSEVAQYHSELSGGEANSSLEAPVREKIANIKLVSTDCSDIEASKGEASLVARKVRKTSTPSILKRDKKRQRVLSAPHYSSCDESGYQSRHHTTPLEGGFLSPLSNEKSSASKELTFSPSIFLSRPDQDQVASFSRTSSSSSAPLSKPEAAAPPSSLAIRFSRSPSSESDCAHSMSSDTDGGSFVTSTPIKAGKENVVRSSDSEEMWSPTILLNKRHRHLRDTNESSSGSDSDGVKKPCLRGAPHPHRRKSKARTKLSPLLENACSPISKDTSAHHQPSPLTTALATTPTRNVSVSLPHQQHPTSATISTATPSSCVSKVHVPPQHASPTFIGPSLLGAGVGVANPSLGQKLLSSTTPITINRPFPAVSAFLPLSTTLTQPHLLQQNHLSRLQAFSYPLSNSALQHYSSIIPNTASTMPSYFPLVGLMAPPTVVAPPPTSYLSYNNPYSTEAHMVSMNASYESTGRNSSSSKMVLDESRRDSKQMKSVPPWFIFSNNRSEKRSRLTEAINKSLSETPSQTAKLPAEWTKLACGQTCDQKQLTEKARYFMQCRPRQLTFTDDMD